MVRWLGGTGVERVDVEAASAEHPGDAGQHAELVFDQDGKGMAHGKGLARRNLGARRLGRFAAGVKRKFPPFNVLFPISTARRCRRVRG